MRTTTANGLLVPLALLALTLAAPARARADADARLPASQPLSSAPAPVAARGSAVLAQRAAADLAATAAKVVAPGVAGHGAVRPTLAGPTIAGPTIAGPTIAGPTIASRFAILVDARSGAVLWTRHATTARAPASLTKMLTALLVRASLPLDAVAVTGKDAARTPPSKLALKPGQKITVGQALAALMVISANDMAVLLADRTAGSVRRFETAMNLASQHLGLRQSSWHSTNGLDAPAHRSSAYDLAILARAVLRDPWLAKTVRTEKVVFTTPDRHRHELNAHSRFLREYQGAVGVKTGFTDQAGRCLAAAATRNGRTLIAIVLHSPDPPADATQLMNWGFGAGRDATTGQALPPYVAVPSVRTLLAPVPTSTVVPATTAAPPAATAPSALGSQVARWRGDNRLSVGIGATAGVALLASTGLVMRRRRRRTSTPP
jgi:D-alanyl-D-alanine carboxypeptidase